MDQEKIVYQILELSAEFYLHYPNPLFTEILKKRNRRYNCLFLNTYYGYNICIPYRTETSHPYAYHFEQYGRASAHRSGLDYTKIVIIKDEIYLCCKDSVIDKDEYIETVRNIKQISREAQKFVNDYICAIQGIVPLHPKEFIRRYQFSPLKYFHTELGIWGTISPL